MGKKKGQLDHSVLAAGDSSDSVDENQTEVAGIHCLHASKAVHLVGVKKQLKNDNLQQCFDCSRTNKLVESENTGEKCLYICLKCGLFRCGNGLNHAEQHSKNTLSVSHDLALNPATWIVWCFKCSIEIPPQYSKNLLECVEFVKRYAMSKNVNFDKPLAHNSSENVADFKPLTNASNVSKKNFNICVTSSLSSNDLRYSSVYNSLPKARGLANLGNTCFFNAVLQCLAQTPFLVPLLEEMKEEGETFKLPGGEIEIANEKLELEPLEGTLKEWGKLTKTLVETLSELQSGKLEVFSPQKLLTLLHAKCPQFAGFDQHDSHELLRQLLEMVRTEDLERYKIAILEKLNMHKKSLRENITDELKKKISAYGRQANNLMLRPEQVFRGFLVSTLECQECHNTSEHVESFLDLSLPVMADKPVHIRRKSNSEDGMDPGISHPSKHQLKKMRKQATRNRRAKNRINIPSNSSGDAITEENIKNSSDSDNQDESDADIEDNAEAEPEVNPSQDVIESGYSSEKPVNGDSTCGSPSSESNVHMNRDSAIASPITNDNLITNKPVDQVLDVTIPENSLSKDNALISSPGSQISMACQPSPLTSSSEMNLECRLSPEMEVGIHGDRPTSRLEFISESLENNSGLQCTYVENVSENLPPYDKNNYNIQLDGNRNLNDDNHLTPMLDVENDKITRLDSQFRKLDLEVSTREKQWNMKNFYDLNEDDDDNSLLLRRDTFGLMPQRNQVEPFGECTLHSCLNQFTAKELMTGNNKVGCDACTKKINKGKEGKTVLTNASKQLLISSPPAILILHLKRFQVVSFTFKKKSREVKFPMVFDLTPYCSVRCKDNPSIKNDQIELLYSLYGVVEHKGTLHGGHYGAYVKIRESLKSDDIRWSFLPNNYSSVIAEKSETIKSSLNGATGGTIEPPAGKWYYISDSHVVEVKEECVLRSQAYLLFYERFW